MLGFDEARARLLAGLTPLPSERIPVEAALGRVLSEPLVASVPVPAFPYSAMDGYALATRDLVGAAPFRLVVKGESRTGRPSTPQS